MGRFSCLLAVLLAASGAFAAADIRDIRGPLPLASPPPFILSGAVLLLAAGLLLSRRRSKRSSRHEVAVPPAVPPGPAADELLACLAADYRQGACPGGQALIRLDRLLRGALAASSGIPAMRLTAVELLPRLEAAAILNPGELALLGSLLSLCDRVKFAGHSPAADEVERALNAAGNLIAATLPGRAS
jgi:LPXTG-motif cell wall-anchored protein